MPRPRTTRRSRGLTYPTSFGDGWIEHDDTKIIATGLPGTEPPASPADDAAAPIREMAAALTAYWEGRPLPAVTRAMLEQAAPTRLTARIYEVVSAIPPGSTLTYAEVAARAGRPGAARAVGAAMARNPMAPIIPCHRVVGSDGDLRGYGGGLLMKQAMLEMEAGDG